MKASSLDKADQMIIKILKSAAKPLSTYDIAKKLEISWSTANIHCYKMMAFGVLKSKEDEVKLGVKRVTWWVK
ncbi:MAG: hypothetical protein ABIH52_00560 [Candidatus Aenigmatarchaeota archaeon]